jgi:predicted O-methyltransferase YrrM
VKLLDVALKARYEHNAIQKHEELAGFLALIADLEPLNIIVEVGAFYGGTLWAWQQLGDVRVIGVDLPPEGYPDGPQVNDLGMTVILGDSHAQSTVDRLLDELAGEPIDVLFIDGDHTYEGVKADYELYSPLVRPGGVIGFHDICTHPTMPFIEVDKFWMSLVGDKEEILTPPYTWGGIGVIHAEAPDEAVANRAATLAGYRKQQDRIYHDPNSTFQRAR